MRNRNMPIPGGAGDRIGKKLCTIVGRTIGLGFGLLLTASITGTDWLFWSAWGVLGLCLVGCFFIWGFIWGVTIGEAWIG